MTSVCSAVLIFLLVGQPAAASVPSRNNLLFAPFHSLATVELKSLVTSFGKQQTGFSNASATIVDVDFGDVAVDAVNPLVFAAAAFSSPSNPRLQPSARVSREAVLEGWAGNTIIHDVISAGGEAVVLFQSLPTILAWEAHRHDDEGKSRFHRYGTKADAMQQVRERMMSTTEAKHALAVDTEDVELYLTSEGSTGSVPSSPSSLPGVPRESSGLLVIAEPKYVSDYVSGANDGAPWHDQTAATALVDELLSFAADHGIALVALLYQEAKAEGGSLGVKLAVINLAAKEVEQPHGVEATAEDFGLRSSVQAECLSSVLLSLVAADRSAKQNGAIDCSTAAAPLLRSLQNLLHRMAPSLDAPAAAPPSHGEHRAFDLDAAMQAFVSKEEAGTKNFREELLQPLQEPYHTYLLDIAAGLSYGGLEEFPVSRIDQLRKEDGLDTEGEASTSISQQMARWLHWRADANKFFTKQTKTAKEKFIEALMARKKAEAQAKAEGQKQPVQDAVNEDAQMHEALEVANSLTEAQAKVALKAGGITAEP